jgi:hypothetical protein
VELMERLWYSYSPPHVNLLYYSLMKTLV